MKCVCSHEVEIHPEGGACRGFFMGQRCCCVGFRAVELSEREFDAECEQKIVLHEMEPLSRWVN